ncbi:MAG TPA: alpha-glucosidase [Firmicutes bacterium]|nr:alpha-glucosidase [Bacillota bacterium]
MLTIESRIKEIYAHPLGRDLIKKVLHQKGLSDRVITNPFVSRLKLKQLPFLTRGYVDQSFLATLLQILNSERERPRPAGDAPVQPAWWKEAVFYQIYPRSFKDSNGDGIGDLRGIIEKLDYLKELGVDAIWLSPVYDSPNDDNGYDIRDYHKIMTEFGRMADFDQLLREVHARGMKLIMDLVINHTSDEHEWFQKALAEPDSKYGSYYLFRDTPNNWTSLFGGSAWKYCPERNQYVLHLFSKKQIDLNWENPELRAEIMAMIRWWLEKGVDGFRMDVINFISKREGLPDGNEKIGALMGIYGVEHYFYGPRLHEYLRQIRKEAFAQYGAFAVGETPGIGLESAKLLTADYRKELDLIFSFDHLDMPGRGKFDDYQYDLNYYKEYIIYWLENYGNQCWMSLFFENHDQPRMVSRVDPDPQYRMVVAKLLATMLLTLPGTPFIYQGQEIAMINKDFRSIAELRDIESLNFYAEWRKELGDHEAFQRVLVGSRDHARAPMQWTKGQYAGFSTVEPWIGADADYQLCNVEDQMAAADSVFHYYRQLIQWRKTHRTLIYGEITFVNKKAKDLFTYYRRDEQGVYYVECNLSRKKRKRKGRRSDGERLLANYPESAAEELRPYEAAVWKLK